MMRRPRGFSVLELLIVVAIMGLVVGGMALRGREPVPPSVRAQAAARDVAAALKLARARAIAQNRAIWVRFELDPARYQLTDEPERALPGGVTLDLLAAKGEVEAAAPGADGGAGRIRFDGDGSSSGGRVGVTAGSRRFWVGVDWLTGKVTLAAEAG